MKLVIGGSYQGKLDYAKSIYNNADPLVFECTDDGNINLKCDIICHLQNWTYWCVKRGLDPIDLFFNNLENNDIIVCCDDISCGVVPMDKLDRLWREANGRLLIKVSNASDEVYRVFCGLGMRIK